MQIVSNGIQFSGKIRKKYHLFVICWICPERDKGWDKFGCNASKRNQYLHRKQISTLWWTLPAQTQITLLSISVHSDKNLFSVFNHSGYIQQKTNDDIIFLMFPIALVKALFFNPKALIIPTLFRKSVGDIVIASVRLSVRPSVCPLCYLLPKRWTESNQIWWVACLHKWGVQEHVYFWPRPQGPWGGVKRSNINNFQFQSQF